MDKPTRVLVANRPRLMRELILETFSNLSDIEVVGEVRNEVEIAEQVEKTRPDFLIIALDEPGERPAICDIVLREHPGLRIIAIEPTKSSSTYYWASLDIHSTDFEASEQSILEAVRRKPDFAVDRS